MLTIRPALLALLCATGLPALAADEFQLADPASSRWQARVQLGSLAEGGLESTPQLAGGSRILSANLLGDYYLTGSGFGGVRGGLRATGGMMFGPLSMSQSNAGLALGGSGSSRLSYGQRSLNLLSPSLDTNDPSASLSYLGIGYTGHAVRSGFSFSADLGLVNSTGLNGISGLRLGVSRSQGMEDALRDLRFKPVLQLGLSYSY